MADSFGSHNVDFLTQLLQALHANRVLEATLSAKGLAQRQGRQQANVVRHDNLRLQPATGSQHSAVGLFNEEQDAGWRGDAFEIQALNDQNRFCVSLAPHAALKFVQR